MRMCKAKGFLCILVVGITLLVTSVSWGQFLGDEEYLGHSGDKVDLAARYDVCNLHLAYSRDSQIYYLRQIEGHWESQERWVEGSSAATYDSQRYPHIAVDSVGNAHFAWVNPDKTAVTSNFRNLD